MLRMFLFRLNLTLLTIFFFILGTLEANPIIKSTEKRLERHGFNQGTLLNSRMTTASVFVYSVFDKGSPNYGLFPIRLYVDNPLKENIQAAYLSTFRIGWDGSTFRKEFHGLPFSEMKQGYIDLLLPVHNSDAYSNSFQSKLINTPKSQGGTYFSTAVHPVAVTSSAPVLIDRLRKDLATSRRSSNPNDQLSVMNFKALTQQVDQLLGWNYLVISEDEFKSLSDPENQEVSRSFEYFLKRGGQLWVYKTSKGKVALPSNWNALKKNDHAKPNELSFFVGKGRVIFEEEKKITWLKMRKHHLGIFRFNLRDLESKIPDIHTNVIGFMMMVLIFALLVGPINLFVFCKGNRVKLMVTTPIISLMAVLFFGLCIVAIEGFGGDGARWSVTYIDPNTHEHFTNIHQVSRTGVVSNAKFELDENSYIWPKNITKGSFSNSRESSEYKLVDNVAISGWFTSRNIQAQTMTMRKMNRERVELKREGDKYKILSTLNTTLNYVWTYDANGNLIGAKNVKPGAEVLLKPLDRFEATFLSDVGLKNRVMEYRNVNQNVLLAHSSELMTSNQTYSGIDWNWNENFYVIPVKGGE